MRADRLRAELKRLDQKGQWLFTFDALKVIFHDVELPTLRVMLTRHAKAGIVEKLGKGLYLNPEATSIPDRAQLALIEYLRPDAINYLTAETVLSEYGVISQMPSRLVVMTTGRGATFELRTPSRDFGVIEFVQTKKSREAILAGTYYDPERKTRVATPRRAYEDLLAMRRSLDLVDEEELAECIEEFEADGGVGEVTP